MSHLSAELIEPVLGLQFTFVEDTYGALVGLPGQKIRYERDGKGQSEKEQEATQQYLLLSR
jgi:hypothetical protein